MRVRARPAIQIFDVLMSNLLQAWVALTACAFASLVIIGIQNIGVYIAQVEMAHLSTVLVPTGVQNQAIFKLHSWCSSSKKGTVVSLEHRLCAANGCT